MITTGCLLGETALPGEEETFWAPAHNTRGRRPRKTRGWRSGHVTSADQQGGSNDDCESPPDGGNQLQKSGERASTCDGRPSGKGVAGGWRVAGVGNLPRIGAAVEAQGGTRETPEAPIVSGEGEFPCGQKCLCS